MKVTTNYDGLQLPEGEVKALIDGKWKSVEFTDDVNVDDMLWLDAQWKDAKKFEFKDRHGHVYCWKRGAVLAK